VKMMRKFESRETVVRVHYRSHVHVRDRDLKQMAVESTVSIRGVSIPEVQRGVVMDEAVGRGQLATSYPYFSPAPAHTDHLSSASGAGSRSKVRSSSISQSSSNPRITFFGFSPKNPKAANFD